MNRTTIVILGGGIGGIVTANHLAKLIPRGKVLFEKWWLAPIGFRKNVLQSLLKVGSSVLKIPVKL
ncbi:MAG: hypothetical protein AB1775_05850 [Bacteroidota bacterium]